MIWRWCRVLPTRNLQVNLVLALERNRFTPISEMFLFQCVLTLTCSRNNRHKPLSSSRSNMAPLRKTYCIFQAPLRFLVISF